MKALIAFIAIVLGAGMYVQAPPQLISYAVTANKGDTLWDICSFPSPHSGILFL